MGLDAIESRQGCALAHPTGIPVMYSPKPRSREPEDVEKLYTAAIEAGAARICVADTVGHATPWGTRTLVKFVRKLVDRVNPKVKIDWHGHEDRGLGVINCIAALEAGVDRVHGTAGGLVNSSGTRRSIS